MRRSLATAVSALAVSLPAFSATACGCNCAKSSATTTTLFSTTTTELVTTTSLAPEPTTTIPSEYVIQKGDRLSDIAKKFHLTVAELVAANHLLNPDKILYGQTLIIPKPGSIPTTTTTVPITVPTTVAPPATTLAFTTTSKG